MVMISGCELTGKNSEENICAFMEQIAADTERDFFMSAEAAQKYGLVDEIMERH